MLFRHAGDLFGQLPFDTEIRSDWWWFIRWNIAENGIENGQNQESPEVVCAACDAYSSYSQQCPWRKEKDGHDNDCGKNERKKNQSWYQLNETTRQSMFHGNNCKNSFAPNECWANERYTWKNHMVFSFCCEKPCGSPIQIRKWKNVLVDWLRAQLEQKKYIFHIVFTYTCRSSWPLHPKYNR